MAEITYIDVPPDMSEPVTVKIDMGKLELGGLLHINILQSDAELHYPDIRVFEVTEKLHTFVYMPPNPGIYTFTIKYNHKKVSGSPLELNLKHPDGKLISMTKKPSNKLRAREPLTIVFDSFLGGRGEFTAECSGRKSGIVPVSISREGITNKYSFKFLPPQEDVYTLKAWYSKTDVYNSPFTIDLTPVRPDLVKCTNISLPEDRNGPLEMDVSTVGCGSAKLTSVCKSSSGRKFPVQIDKVSPDHYHLTVEDPPKDDDIRLDVKYGGKQVKDSPFEFKKKQEIAEVVLDMPLEASADPDKVKIGEIHKPDTAGPGKQVWVDVDCSDAGPGVLTAECLRKNKGQQPMEVAVDELENKGNYHVQFGAEDHDLYTLSLLYNGKAVPGGIIEMDILQPPDPSKVKVGELHVPQAIGHEDAWIDLDCSEAGHGEVQANCSRSDADYPVNVTTLDSANNYRVKFTPDQPDIYKLSLLFAEEPIPGGAMDITVPPSDPSKVKSGELHVPKFAGEEPAWLDVDCSGAGYGTLTATCIRKDDNSPVEVSVNKLDSSSSNHVEFVPEHPGTYALSLCFNGEPVPDGTFEVEALQKPDPTKVKLGDLHAPEFAGEEPLWMDVDCSEAGTGELTAEWSGRNSGPLQTSVEELDTKGKYRLKFPASTPDCYSLELQFAGEQVPEGMFVRDVFQRPDASKVKLGDLHTPEFAGTEPLWIDVDCSEAGKGELTAEWSGKDSGPSEVLKEELEPEGNYRMKFPAEHSDVYTLSLLFAGQPVPEGSFEMTMLDRPDPSKVKLGELYTPEYAGDEPLWIDVDYSEAGAGELMAEWKGKNSGPLDVTVDKISPKGVDRVQFPARDPDCYTLSLLFAGQPVPGGSFEKDIPQRPDAEKVKIGDLHTPDFAGDEPLWVDVDCSEAGAGDLSAEWIGRDSGPLEFTKEDLDSKGKSRLKFPAKNPDFYNLSLSFSDQPIPGGSFEFDIPQRPDAEKVIIGDLHTPDFAGNEPLWVDVDCSEAGAGDLSAEWIGRDSGPLGFTKEDLDSKGKSRLKFPAENPDFYKLSLSFADQPVPGGSFEFDIPQRPDAEKVKVGELHTPAFAGDEPLWMDVDCSEAGAGELTAEWIGKDSGPSEVSIEELKPKGNYRMKFPAEHSDVYSLSLLFAGQPVPGGSFEMTMLDRPDASKVKLGELYTPEYAGEEPLWIDVDYSEAGAGELTAEWKGKNSGPLDVTLDKISPKGVDRMHFPAQEPDFYTLTLLFAGQPVPGGSFEMPILQRPDPSKVKLGELHVPEFAGNEPLWLDIDCSEAGTGDLTADWNSASAGPLEVVKDELDPNGKYRLKFPATHPDRYSLSLFYGGEPVPGGSQEVDIPPGPDAKKVKVGDLHIPEFAGNEPLWLDVDCSEAGTGDLAAEWSCGDGRPLDVSVEELGSKGKYRMKFPAERPDVYNLSLSFSGQPLSSFVMDILQRPDPSKVKIGDMHVPEFAGEECVWLEVDCSEAGHGALTAQCIREDDEGSVLEEVSIEDGPSKGSHLVKFVPLNAGIHTLSLFFSEQPVPGASRDIEMFARPDATKVKLIGDLHVPDSAGEGDVWIDVDCSDAGCGELSGQYKGQNQDRESEITPEVLSKDNYRIKFTPQCADIYTMSLFFSGESVPNGIFEVNLLPKSDAKLVRHLGTFIPDDAGDPVTLKFDASQAGPGTMRGRVSGVTQAGTVSSRVDLIDEDDVIYHLMFIPEGADTYNVDVYWSDESIPGSPIYVKIVYPAEVDVGDPVVHTKDDHHSVQMSVDTADAGPGDLTVSCIGAETGPHDAEISQDSSTKHTIHFHPRVPDLYQFRVYFSGTEVKDSPIDVDLRPQLVDESSVADLQQKPDVVYALLSEDDDDDDNETKKQEPKSPSKLQLYVGEPVSLVIDNADGHLTASAIGERTGESMISIHSADDRGAYQVKFQPNKPDIYNIDICLDQEHVPGSPYIIECLEREPTIKDIGVTVQNSKERYRIDTGGDDSSEEESKTSLTIPTRMQMYVGDPLVLLIDDLDGDIGDLITSAMGERMGECSITTRSTEKSGSYRIEFQPTEADMYTVEVSHFKTPIPGSPFIIEFIEREISTSPKAATPAPISNSLDSIVAIEEPILEHPIHKPYLIKCVGSWDRVEETLAYAIHDDSCIRDSLKIRKWTGKKPMLVFYPNKLGVHIIHIKRGSEEVQGSPFKLRIVKAACRFISTPDEAYVGELAEIKVDGSNAGEGDLHVLATVPIGGKGTVFDHTEDGNGIYTIQFTPKMAGQHRIEVKWAGEPIEGSPAVVNVLEPTDEIRRAKDAASKVFVLKEDNNDPESEHFQRNRTHFHVNTEKAGKGELTLKSQGPSNPRIFIYKEEEGLYSCHVKPTVTGKYEILILWNGTPIPGNPYKMKYKAEKMFAIHDLDLEAENFMLQQPSSFVINCSGHKGKLDISTTPANVADIMISPIENNMYSVQITPLVAGNHQISVKFAERHVLHSPYHVQFEAPDRPIIENKMNRLSDLNLIISAADSTFGIVGESTEDLLPVEQSKVKASGPGLQQGVVGQEGNFTIDTGAAGEGKLEVAVQGPKGSFHTKVRRHPDNDRTLLARYDPTHVGEYTVNILWCEKHIEGSPFAVNIKGQQQTSG